MPTSSDRSRQPEPPPRLGSCLVCGAARQRSLFERGSYRYARCERCGLASLWPLPEVAAARELYDDAGYFSGDHGAGYQDYEADAAAHRRNAASRLTALERAAGWRGAGTRRVLDVGCATGFFLEVARERGYEIAGVEVSSWARRRAQARLGIEVAQDVASLARTGGAGFDAICIAQVLEHEPAAREMLAEARRLLRPGGVLFIETWDCESLVARAFGAHWQQISPPSVVHLFSARSLRQLLASEGLEDVRIRRGLKWVGLGFVGHLLASKYGTLGRAANAGIVRAGLAERALPYALGDLIVATSVAPQPASD